MAQSVQHLDRDPNDPRTLTPAGQLPTLDEVPEAPATPVGKSEVEDEHGIQHVGVDPNDTRAIGPLEDVSLPTGEDAD
jgi:hypothetical protein